MGRGQESALIAGIHLDRRRCGGVEAGEVQGRIEAGSPGRLPGVRSDPRLAGRKRISPNYGMGTKWMSWFASTSPVGVNAARKNADSTAGAPAAYGRPSVCTVPGRHVPQ